MAALRQTHSVENKHKLSNTLRNWLPILHSSLSDLGEAMSPFVEGNPVVEVESGYEENFEKKIPRKIISGNVSNSRTEQIEALTIQTRSLYDVLDEQLGAPLFPTPISQSIASFVVCNLDENGYYEGNSEEFCQKHNIYMPEFQKIRLRFAHIEPVGIGAVDLAESFLKHIFKAVLEDCDEDMQFFNQRIDKTVIDTLTHVIDSDFERLTYTKAIEILTQADRKWEYPVEWGCDLQTEHERFLTEEVFKLAPVFRQVNRIWRSPDNRNSRLVELLSQLQRGLPTKLNNHAFRFFLVDDRNNILEGQRFEIEPIRRIVVSRDGFGIAVDHDGFITTFFCRQNTMNTRVVKLNSLTNAVGAGA